ncbi:MAG: tRNA (adenosine(37)-N6)-dimethylallyltransferase MiaA [Kiritimatiellae bacterium]|nr:tRNA (adenosine(37)-N6)-dimethylallyltransferase MiaA [Kiritimatiellia bacterium]
MQMPDAPLPPLLIAGATATGKSAVAQWLAERTGAAIVSTDSMLVYRGMDVGTAKPSAEERGRVRYIGLDCVEPGERFSAGDWLQRVREGVAALPAGTPLIAAGGTGLYFRALQQGLDAPPCDLAVRQKFRALYDEGGIDALQAEMARLGVAVPPGDGQNPRRLMRALEKATSGTPAPAPAAAAGGFAPFANAAAFLLTMDRDALAARIERRARKMFDEGIVEEAVRIFGDGAPSETAAGAIGYAEALSFARGELTLEEAIERVSARTRQLAKRQRTWFRHQFEAVEVAVSPDDTPEAVATRIVALLRK